MHGKKCNTQGRIKCKLKHFLVSKTIGSVTDVPHSEKWSTSSEKWGSSSEEWSTSLEKSVAQVQKCEARAQKSGEQV